MTNILHVNPTGDAASAGASTTPEAQRGDPLRARVEIDYNRRTPGNLTRAHFEDCDRIPVADENVTVHQPEDGTEGNAVVVAIDEDHRMVYLVVDWASLREITHT